MHRTTEQRNCLLPSPSNVLLERSVFIAPLVSKYLAEIIDPLVVKDHHPVANVFAPTNVERGTVRKSLIDLNLRRACIEINQRAACSDLAAQDMRASCSEEFVGGFASNLSGLRRRIKPVAGSFY